MNFVKQLLASRHSIAGFRGARPPGGKAADACQKLEILTLGLKQAGRQLGE
jgi:hypothetical protein